MIYIVTPAALTDIHHHSSSPRSKNSSVDHYFASESAVTMVSAEAPTQSEVSRLLQLDTTPWYQKSNLRNLYLCLVPAALGVEMTSGYDGSILNGLQAVGPWLECEW